jgi:thymidylate kinase
LAQIQAQEFALQQASSDRQLQLAASIELGLERLDTRLQTAQLEFRQAMVAEENRHEEKMTEYRKVFASHSNYDGLPTPLSEEEGIS